MSIARLAKTLLLAAIALFFTLVVVNNITDFDSNYQFVRHVLLMDTTFPSNHAMARVIHAPTIHKLFYISIIAWETFNAVLCWWGSIALLRTLRAPATDFARAKSIGIAALTAGMLLWFVAFLTIGAEYFLMWQSRLWNGQDAAFRIFACEGLVLILLMLPEGDL